MRKDAADIIYFSDLHINSTVALAHPIVVNDEGGEHRFSEEQRKLFHAFSDVLEKMSERKRSDRPMYAVLNGDLVENNKRPTFQVITHNPTKIVNHAIKVLEPVFSIADYVFVVRGTEAHVGESANLEEMIAQNFDNTVPSKYANSWWHLRSDFGGAKFDIAHHATMGRLPWTEKNAANKIASIVRSRYAEMKEKEPNIAVRSHVHRYSDSGDNFGSLKAFTTPCWSLFTSYSYRISFENVPPDIGSIFMSVEEGQVQDQLWKYEFERDEVWNLK